MDIGEGKDASWTTPQQHKANWGWMTEAKRVFRSGLAGTDHRWSCGLSSASFPAAPRRSESRHWPKEKSSTVMTPGISAGGPADGRAQQ